MGYVRGEYKGNNLVSNKCGKLGQTMQDQNGVSMEWFMTPTKLLHLNNSIIQIPFAKQFFFGVGLIKGIKNLNNNFDINKLM
jgi:hypothetical protein